MSFFLTSAAERASSHAGMNIKQLLQPSPPGTQRRHLNVQHKEEV